MAYTPLLPYRQIGPGRWLNSALSLNLQATTQKVAQRIVLSEAQTWTGLNIRLTQTGTPVGVTFNIRLQTEASAAPSGADVTNSVISGIAQPAGTGWIGNQAFSGNVSLSANTPYWIILEIAGATTLNTSNFFGWNGLSDGSISSAPQQIEGSTFNGTVWATPVAGRLLTFVAATLSGNYGQVYHTTAFSRLASGTTRVGLKVVLDCRTVIRGWYFFGTVGNLATVGNLECKIFDSGNTQYGSLLTITPTQVWSTASILGNAVVLCDFGADITLPAGTYYLSHHQASDASASQWKIQELVSDYSDGGLTYDGASNVLVATRTADSGAWTEFPLEDGMFNLLFVNQSQPGGGGGLPWQGMTARSIGTY